MRTRLPLTLALLALAASTLLAAQETRRTEVNPSPNPADDAKENSSAVPDVYALTGHFDRIVILRFKYKTDLLAGLQQMVKQEHIQNGVILQRRRLSARLPDAPGGEPHHALQRYV